MRSFKQLFGKKLTLQTCALLMMALPAYAATPKEAIKTLTDTVDTEQAVLTEGQQWEKEQITLAQEIKQAKLEAEWYNLHIQTLERYVETAKNNVAELTNTKIELERLEAALEANLVTTVQHFEEFVQKDIPFLAEERAARIAFLHDSLNDYALGLEEKLRRVFEALQVESDYAKGFEITDESIDTPTGKHTVKIVRIGRVGLFAVAPDGSKAWQYTPAGYVELPQQYLASLQALQHEHVQSLPVLPFVGDK